VQLPRPGAEGEQRAAREFRARAACAPCRKCGHTARGVFGLAACGLWFQTGDAHNVKRGAEMQILRPLYALVSGVLR